MARLYKRGKYWWYQFRGRRYSTRCTDRKAAEAAAREIERRLVDPSYRPAHETTLGKALSDFMQAKRAEGKSEGTLDMQGAHVRHIARVLGEDTPLPYIGAPEVDRYIRIRHDEGASRSTIGKELTTFRGTLRIARRHGTYPFALDEVFPRFRVAYKPLERRHTEAELLKLLAKLPEKRAAVCAFIAATSADAGSVWRAEPGDVDLTRWRAIVRGTKNTYRFREVPVTLPLFRRLLKLAAPHIPFERWDNSQRDLTVACRRAGVPRVTLRDLRRTHGYILRARGVEPHLIARSMGHADSTMVEKVYGKLPIDSFERLMVARLGRRTSGTAEAQKRTPKRGKRGKRAA